MEDMDFFCVDNLPVPLITKFAELGMAGNSEYQRVVLVTDVRSGTSFEGLFKALDDLEKMKCPYRILYMDADTEVIIQRYKESRRAHPLIDECDSLEKAIELERKMLAPLHERAEYIIDTTAMPTAKLKGELRRLFGRGLTGDGKMDVSVQSFGFKHGLPMDADLVFDVRFLPNPYYSLQLRPLTGLDAPVNQFLFEYPLTQDFLDRLSALVRFLLPLYDQEGKTALVIAIGCTGGRHRSVAIAHALAQAIRAAGFPVGESHRDLGR